MNSPRVRREPARAVPVVFFALIFNLVMGPLAPVALSVLGPQNALAYVGSTSFELDGNIDHTGSGHDWDQVYADNQNGTNTSGADSIHFITDAVNTTADDIFKGGGSKDQQTVQGGPWLWSAQKPQPKDDITHAFAAAYTIGGHTIAYFGLDKYEVDGDNQVGFWFFKDHVAKTDIASNGGFKFSGEHAVGDILVLADYTNGGSVPTFKVYQWVGSGGSNGSLDLVASGGQCDSSNQFACGITNSTTFTSNAWPYQNRDVAAQTWPPGGLFEGGLDLTHFGLATGCFSSFLAETRSSQSVDATLSDFALGSFSFCETPEIETSADPKVSSLGEAASIIDIATLSGTKGPVQGTVDFFVCGPTQTAQACTSGGDPIGSSSVSPNGQALSDSFTAPAGGFYCFRAEYTPAEDSKYLPTSHTNDTTECVEVLLANLIATKTADNETVGAGEQIGFTITVTNNGPGDAFDVALNDPLPAGSDLDWSVTDKTFGVCSIAGSAGSQVLTCSTPSMLVGTSVSVHVVSDTSVADCQTLHNVATITASHHAELKPEASVTVQCPGPALVIEKVADKHVVDVTAGPKKNTTVTWTLSYSLQNGPVTNAVITDPIPTGLSYVDGSASNGGVYDPATRTLTWTFPQLSASGTVSFRTTVDNGVGGGVSFTNVTTIESEETPSDEGHDTIKTVEQAPPKAATPTPSVPNTALALGQDGTPIQIPIELVILVFLGSLGALAFANVRTAHRRR